MDYKQSSTTGLRGVYTTGSKFTAKVMVDRVFRTIGTYDTPREAAAVRDEVVHFVTKGFCQMNFKDSERVVTTADMYMCQVAAFCNRYNVKVMRLIAFIHSHK